MGGTCRVDADAADDAEAAADDDVAAPEELGGADVPAATGPRGVLKNELGLARLGAEA